jgi:tellurite methyltransferase
MRTELPAGVTAYKRTPTFEADSVPAGLRAQHSTKAGVWARVVVLEGSLPFRFLEPDEELVLLTPERPGIVAPTQLHQAEPGPGVRFYVEFHRAEPPLPSSPQTA